MVLEGLKGEESVADLSLRDQLLEMSPADGGTRIFSLCLLVDLLEVARPPGLVEKRLGRAVEPQQSKPALARNGAQIIRLRRPLGKFWAEIKVNRSVITIFQFI